MTKENQPTAEYEPTRDEIRAYKEKWYESHRMEIEHDGATVDEGALSQQARAYLKQQHAIKKL